MTFSRLFFTGAILLAAASHAQTAPQPCVVNVIPAVLGYATPEVSDLTKELNKRGFSVRYFSSERTNEAQIRENVFPGDFVISMGSGSTENGKCSYEYGIYDLVNGKEGSHGSFWNILGKHQVKYGRVQGRNCPAEVVKDIKKMRPEAFFCNIEGRATRKQDNGCLAEIPNEADENGKVYSFTKLVSCEKNPNVGNLELE